MKFLSCLKNSFRLFCFLLPLRNKQVGISRTAIISVAGEGQILAVIGENGEGIKGFAMGHTFQIFTIDIYQIKVEGESLLGLKITGE